MVEIGDKADCCGCSACTQICPKRCIKMMPDEEGFLYPEVDAQACISCNSCEEVCPVINHFDKSTVLRAFAYRHDNDNIRETSSSGGAFYYLACRILNENGVVYGAGFSKSWEVTHKRADNLELLEDIRRSKYVQSNINDTYKSAKDDLKNGRKVLFTGTPCQIAGLKHYLRKEYLNLYLVDVFCHGVPSPEVYKFYLHEIIQYPEINATKSPTKLLGIRKKNSKKEILSINFRDKEHSRWRLFSLKLRFKENNTTTTIANNWEKDIFNQGFLKHLYLRPSCHQCSFRNQTSGADLTIGDFWGINTALPNILLDDSGYSAVIVNTRKGIEITDGMTVLADSTFNKIAENNGSLIHSPTPHIMRDYFFKNYKKRGMLFTTMVCIQSDFFSKIVRKIIKLIA